MKIGAVLIVKNEEAMLPQCLESVKNFDEIVIVDTGSTDSTIQIARKYTNLIFCNYVWNDNFAEARNYAKSKSRADWILSIDADESLYDQNSVREAVAIAEEQKARAVNVKCISSSDNQVFDYPRLFKNVPEVFWEGAVHNSLSYVGIDAGNVRLKIGYSPAHLADPERSYRILKKESEKPGCSPRILYYLGREYHYRGEEENCLVTLGKYVQNTRFLSEKADAFLIMAQAYWKLGRVDDARDACVQALIINANFKEAIIFMSRLAGDGAGNEKWQKNADQWKRLAETADNTDVLFIRKT